MQNSKILQNKINKRSKFNLFKNNIYKWVLYIICILMALIILAAIFSVLKGGIDILVQNNVPPGDWLFADQYKPSSGIVCGLAMIFNTLWMSFFALLIACPIAIGTALIITRTLKEKSAALLYSIVAILAAVPSVIYGALGYYVLDNISSGVLGFGSGSLFTIIIMIAFMITPTITIMSVASIRLSDRKMEDSSYALGATKTQTSIFVTLRSARTGIITGIIFALGRSIAETTAISMVGSPNSIAEGAVTLVWWKQSLFMGPAILTSQTSEISPEWPVAPVISMLMIITTLSVFALMKLVEYKGDENNVTRKQSKNYIKERDVKKKYEEFGITSLSKSEQNTLIKIDKAHNDIAIQRQEYDKPELAFASVLQRSSISSSWKFEEYKKHKTTKHNSFIYISAAIGVFLLALIMGYLLIGGFQWFTWDYLTLRGRAKVDGYDVIGLSLPIIGTYISMLLSVAIAAPVGIMVGLALSTYVSKETKPGWVLSYIMQALTAVPGIIWGAFATTFLMSTNLYKSHIGFIPIIFMIFIILPSVIKSVEEAGGRVKKNLREGSYALGATTLTTTRRIYIKEVFPSIVSGVLLAMSIAMAESTIFIYLIRVFDTPTNINEQMSSGGYTLASLIFALKGRSVVTYPESANQIKTVGIVLMLIILAISYTSTLVNKKKFFESSLMGIAIMLFPFAVYINSGSVVLMAIDVIVLVFAIFIAPIIVKINETRKNNIIRSRGL